MNKRIKTVLITTLIFGVLAISLVFSKEKAEKTGQSQPVKKTEVRIVNIDEFAAHPEKYPGYIGITGPVKSLDKQKHLIVMGCEDACISVPIKFMGTMPKINSTIIAFGILKKESKRYYFDADKVTTK